MWSPWAHQQQRTVNMNVTRSCQGGFSTPFKLLSMLVIHVMSINVDPLLIAWSYACASLDMHDTPFFILRRWSRVPLHAHMLMAMFTCLWLCSHAYIDTCTFMLDPCLSPYECKHCLTSPLFLLYDWMYLHNGMCLVLSGQSLLLGCAC